MRYAKHFSQQTTPQSEPIPGSTQTENDAGGYAWAVDDWARLDRFLILGSEGGTYYVGEHKLTVQNAEAVLRCIETDGKRAVNRIVEISESGRAPKNDPALFALAMAAADKDVFTRHCALEALPQVARTGTHLFAFLDAVQEFRGWGRGLRNAVARWYLDKDLDKLAYQVLKYRQRGGWTHRDALRLAHPQPSNPVFEWIIRAEVPEDAPELLAAFRLMQASSKAQEAVDLIGRYPQLTWEMVPTEFLADAQVWGALLPNMPLTAMTRNLGRMTANGCLKPMSKQTTHVVAKLDNPKHIHKSRLHPIALLAALTTYAQGHGARGKLSWSPIPLIVDALDSAFYAAFDNVEPSGKRLVLALDVSGSMGWGEIAGVPGLTPRAASAAMALVTAAKETAYTVVAFSHQMVPVSISPKQRLDDAINQIAGLPFGATDCALPMLWALEHDIEADAFIIYTDNQTWYGDIHPVQALDKYRRKTGIPAKLVVVAMTGEGFSIADPNDAGMLDVVGFDTATPTLISDFVKE